MKRASRLLGLILFVCVLSGLLTQYGYDPEAPPEKVVTAFQRHFRPSCVDGMADAETRAMLSGLIALYGAKKGARA